MEIGSLVQCIEYSTGLFLVNGVDTQLLPPVLVGEFKVVRKIGKSSWGQDILMFDDMPPVIHPVLGQECGYLKIRYREVQPPMKIDIENIIHENTLQP